MTEGRLVVRRSLQDGGVGRLDGCQPLAAYLARVTGASCTLPVERVQDLTGGEFRIAGESDEWWADAAGWGASAAARACLAAGWRLESVHAREGLVRFTRAGGGP